MGNRKEPEALEMIRLESQWIQNCRDARLLGFLISPGCSVAYFSLSFGFSTEDSRPQEGFPYFSPRVAGYDVGMRLQLSTRCMVLQERLA